MSRFNIWQNTWPTFLIRFTSFLSYLRSKRETHWTYGWRSRGLMLPGATSDYMPPYRILVLSSGVWWSLLLDIRCLWRHSMTSYSRLQTNVLAKFVDITCILFYTPLTHCTMCHCNEHKLTALQVTRQEQNTALNAKTEQFITAKISGNALKHGSRTHSVLHQRGSQLQKYSIRLRMETVE